MIPTLVGGVRRAVSTQCSLTGEISWCSLDPSYLTGDISWDDSYLVVHQRCWDGYEVSIQPNRRHFLGRFLPPASLFFKFGGPTPNGPVLFLVFYI